MWFGNLRFVVISAVRTAVRGPICANWRAEHCGSLGGGAGSHRTKTKEVILIGGEAYLHEGFLSVTQALKEGGVEVGLTTGGRGNHQRACHAMKSAGIDRVSVSIDGLLEVHDLLRAIRAVLAML
jgi:MoaA/NifB/PqqE/SkfB family radical SAM enzyme